MAATITGVVVIILVSVMAYQDLRTFSINIQLFVLCAIIIACHAILCFGLLESILNTIVNCMIVLVLLLFVWLWFSIKSGENVKIIDTMIGKGDIVFMAIMAPLFSPTKYVVFLIFSFCISIIYAISKHTDKHKPIPLVFFMSISYVIISISNIISA